MSIHAASSVACVTSTGGCRPARHATQLQVRPTDDEESSEKEAVACLMPVSYTHLTLPTILLV
eukprot:4959376-Amphidinium_carterae.1